MNRIKLLFVIGPLDFGGAEKSLVKLCCALSPEKYDISILMLAGYKGDLCDELPPSVHQFFCCRNKTLSFKKQYNRTLNNLSEFCGNKLWGGRRTNNRITRRVLSILSLFENCCYFRYIRKLFKNQFFDFCIGNLEGEPDVIATHCINANNIYVFYRYGTLISFAHDSETYNRADKVISVSKSIKKELIEKYNLSKEKVISIFNIFETEKIKNLALEKTTDIIHSPLMITTVARINEDKGILTAIEAAAILKEKHYDFKWMIVGPIFQDNYSSNCINRINELDLSENVFLLGKKKNPYPYIDEANIYVCPSRFEALPGTIIEALILGKPIISTKTIGAKDLIISGTNGLLCDFDPESIATTIIELYNKQDLQSCISCGAKETAKEFDHILSDYENLFNNEAVNK